MPATPSVESVLAQPDPNLTTQNLERHTSSIYMVFISFSIPQIFDKAGLGLPWPTYEKQGPE